MPSVSKKQFAFMKAVENGYIHSKGLSKNKAKEFTKGVHPSELSEYVNRKDKFKHLSKMMK